MNQVSVGDAVTLRRGASYKSSLVGAEGIPLLGLGTIGKHGGFKDANVRRYSGDAPPRMLVVAGDLYVSLKDMTQEAALLGAVARVPGHIHRARLTQDTIALDPRSDSPVTQDYLYWVLRSRTYRDYCRNHGTGTTNLDLSQSDFLGFTFNPPDLTVQRAHVETLEVLDDKIAANRNVTAQAMSLAQTTVRSRVERLRPLIELAEVVMGTSPKGDLLNLDGEGVPFFQGVRDFGTLYPSTRVSTAHAVRTARDGDILLAVRAPVGLVNVARGETAIGRGLAALHAHEHPATLFYTLREFVTIWDEHQASGTVFAAVNGRQVREARIPVAPDAADELEECVAALHARALAAELENDRLAATRDELLPLLMSGAITVKDAEKRVEEEV